MDQLSTKHAHPAEDSDHSFAEFSPDIFADHNINADLPPDIGDKAPQPNPIAESAGRVTGVGIICLAIEKAAKAAVDRLNSPPQVPLNRLSAPYTAESTVEVEGKDGQFKLLCESNGRLLVVSPDGGTRVSPHPQLKYTVEKNGKIPISFRPPGCTDVTELITGRTSATDRYFMKAAESGQLRLLHVQVGVDPVRTIVDEYPISAVEKAATKVVANTRTSPDLRAPFRPKDMVMSEAHEGVTLFVQGNYQGKLITVKASDMLLADIKHVDNVRLTSDGKIPANFCPVGAVDVSREVLGAMRADERVYLRKSAGGDYTLQTVKVAGAGSLRIITEPVALVDPSSVEFIDATGVGYDSSTKAKVFSRFESDWQGETIKLSKADAQALDGKDSAYRRVDLTGGTSFSRYRRSSDSVGEGRYYAKRTLPDGSVELVEDRALFERYRPSGAGALDGADHPLFDGRSHDVPQPAAERPEGRRLTRDRIDTPDSSRPDRTDRGKTSNVGELVVSADRLDRRTNEILQEMKALSEPTLSKWSKSMQEMTGDSESARQNRDRTLAQARGPAGHQRDIARREIATNLAMWEMQRAKVMAEVRLTTVKVGGRAVMAGVVLKEILDWTK